MRTATTDPATQEYAPDDSARRFRPRMWPTLATALLIPLFIAAGHWQWSKAAAKSELQAQRDARGREPAIQVPAAPVDAQALRYRKIVARGRYEPRFQILIDNRVQGGRAGYHVLTALRVEGSETLLLVNRGWVAALADRRQLPQIATPSAMVEISGTAIVPGRRFFTLGADPADDSAAWRVVWQNLDLERYALAVGLPVQPVVMELGPQDAAGFVREWRRPDERRQTNLSYAFQWWSFALTTAALWVFFSFRRKS